MSLPVDMAWSESGGWVYHTPYPMTDKAMSHATAQARVFYLGLWNDLPDGPAREQIERALRDLETLKIRNAIRSGEAKPIKVLTPSGME